MWLRLTVVLTMVETAVTCYAGGFTVCPVSACFLWHMKVSSSSCAL